MSWLGAAILFLAILGLCCGGCLVMTVLERLLFGNPHNIGDDPNG